MHSLCGGIHGLHFVFTAKKAVVEGKVKPKKRHLCNVQRQHICERCEAGCQLGESIKSE